MNGDCYIFIFVEEQFVIILQNSFQFVQFLTVDEWISISAYTHRVIGVRSVRRVRKEKFKEVMTLLFGERVMVSTRSRSKVKYVQNVRLLLS